jgi:molybdopterin converting factor small subunit
MSTKVHLYSSLQSYTDGQGTLEVEGTTVGECLKDLTQKFPKLGPVLFENESKLSSIVFVSINLESPNPEKLDKALSPGDELYLVLIIVGG